VARARSTFLPHAFNFFLLHIVHNAAAAPDGADVPIVRIPPLSVRKIAPRFVAEPRHT
jgi:hypothetical protein